MAAVQVFEFERDPRVALLEELRAAKRAEMAEQVRQAELIIEYCQRHQVPDDEAATVSERGRDTGLPLAGAGAPCVSEFAVIELATALGMTTDAGRRLVGEVLEVHHRLPSTWDRVKDLELAWWRAARIAQHTMLLPQSGARFVDTRLAAVAHKVGVVATEKLCQEALDHYDPDRAEERRLAAADQRRVDVHVQNSGRDGIVEVTASVETADALDLETALRQAAAQLAAAQLTATGSTEALDVRRSEALGVIARHYLGDLLTTDRPDSARSGPRVKPRQVSIHVHLHDPHTGRLEQTHNPITVAQVQQWCAHPDTQVIIKPIKDLAAHIRVDQYEVPDRLAEQVNHRDGTCIHPHCTRPARSCDNDHAIPYHDGGPTSSHNIAPLCRPHHRAKTHTDWQYWFIRPGTYLWRSPAGYWYHRDPLGTTDLGRLDDRTTMGR